MTLTQQIVQMATVIYEHLGVDVREVRLGARLYEAVAREAATKTRHHFVAVDEASVLNRIILQDVHVVRDVTLPPESIIFERAHEHN